MSAFLFIRDIARKFPLLLAANTVLLVLAGLVGVTSILTLAPLIDLLINPNLDVQSASMLTQRTATLMGSIGLPVTLGSLLAIFLVLNVLTSGFQIFAMHSVLRTKYAVLRDLMLGTFEDFFQARWYFFSSGKQGMLLNTFIREITVVGDAFGAMARFFAAILQSLLYLLVPFYISWQVTLISIASALLFALPFLFLGKISYRLGKLNTTTANQMSSVIQESLGSAKVILGYANQHKSGEALSQAYDAHRRATLKSQTLNIAIPLTYLPLGSAVLIIALLAARQLAVPLSELSVLMYSLYKVIPTVGQLTGEKSGIDNFFPSYEQVMNLKQLAQKLRQHSGTRAFLGFKDKIVIEDLSFAHPGHEPILMNVNICIPKGKMIAIVGQSGAGKSTLIDMIMGFNEPMTGGIKIDDVSLQAYDINSYRRRIGYVPQESILFNMTIRDNLRWAFEDATDEEILQACQQANADEFIAEFPEAYNTLVGDRGVRLSGGQIQRIALARAILRKPELLILDEATSSLDSHSERLIQRAIEAIAKKTTVVVIAHRLSTIVNANYIYVLQKGRVVEEGTYSNLVKMDGQFKRMVQYQELGVVR